MSSQQAVLQVIYPPSAAPSFNMDYYLNNHVSMVKKLWEPQGLEECIVTSGVKDAGYHVQTTLVWKDLESLENVKNADVARDDAKNFTNVPPYRWCDPTRPCHSCHRLGVPCIPRKRSGSDAVAPSAPEQRTNDNANSSKIANPEEETVVLPETSIIDVSTRMCTSQKLAIGVEYDTSALPGGKLSPFSFPSRQIPWQDIIGLSLPSKQSLDHLVDTFFTSVDWFMMIFHETTFRQRYEDLMTSIYIPSEDNINFLWITLLVFGLGAHYSSLTPQSTDQQLKMKQFSKEIIARIEQQFLKIIDSPDEEAVQICVLLGSFFLFNGRPTSGLGILGSGIKIAQVLRLHREPVSTEMSASRLESRRCSWWALEIFDKYAAIAFGRPCSIDDSDCDVNTISDLQSNTTDGPRQKEHLDYHRWKFRLYRIVGPFLGRRIQTNRLESVKALHEQLTSWQKELPKELRLDLYKDKDKDDSQTPSLLQMQALALQLTYDNIQIILHRSLAFGSGSSSQESQSLHLPSSALSREQLFQSALRTSNLKDYSHVLHACATTHAAMHVGICLFTAGVVLCSFAISEPLSATSEAAKNGVTNILRFQHDPLLNQHLLSAQSVRILEDLVKVLMHSEQSFIVGDNLGGSRSGQSTTEANARTRSSSQNASANLSSQSEIDRKDYETSNISQEEPPAHSDNNTNEPSNDIFDGTNFSIGPELDLLSMDSATGVMWTGGNPYLIDPNFADASQLWLWSTNPDRQPFSE
ncbi:hypothetical protein PENSTE_c025G08537 [Penicillium steckii]|uniref:Xylanolytic transcriptional activator regulatory domain-containing protein n=1 Tax=Penicillium steckii TaxID=303698 RepID=A0A1V6SRA5_9EURO|nr:hypothetical protein PENSTE_c025G08537 [Penicillium steckii]